MPDPVDVVTKQVRGFIAAAMAEAVAAERTSARAAELERVRQVANKLTEEYRAAPATPGASQAFDELFRRLADGTLPIPAISVAPDEFRPFDRDFRDRLDDRGLGAPGAAFAGGQRLAEVHGGSRGTLPDLNWNAGEEPDGPFEDNSPEAAEERARLRLERALSERAAKADRDSDPLAGTVVDTGAGPAAPLSPAPPVRTPDDIAARIAQHEAREEAAREAEAAAARNRSSL